LRRSDRRRDRRDHDPQTRAPVLFLVLAFVQSPRSGCYRARPPQCAVLVYVGAVMVLFLFVVMMLDITEIRKASPYCRSALPSRCSCGRDRPRDLVPLPRAAFARRRSQPEGTATRRSLARCSTRARLRVRDRFRDLLLAIVAAITLTMRRRPGLKAQDIAKQVAVRSQDRVRIVKMESSKDP
jgi:NADH-quinone oxidoreductase subunit J